MKWCRNELEQGPAYGIVEDGGVAVLSAAPFEPHERTGERYALASVKTASEYDTKDMIFSLRHYIARITRYATLYPGDVIWFGWGGPTAPALEPGDLVKVVNDAIGVLANRVVRAPG